jgi:predicted transcriptional regulator
MSKVISIRVGDDLHARMVAAAQADRRTLSNWLIVAAERQLDALEVERQRRERETERSDGEA